MALKSGRRPPALSLASDNGEAAPASLVAGTPLLEMGAPAGAVVGGQGGVRAAGAGQGLTLFHFLAQRRHILWDTLGARFLPQSIRQEDTGRCDQNGLG